MTPFNIIVATDSEGGIARKGKLPWRLSQDMLYFKKLTTPQIVIMGRKTWTSLPEKYKPLPERFNIVLTSSRPEFITPSLSPEKKGDVRVVFSFEEALQSVNELKKNPNWSFSEQEIFVIGGGQIYTQAIAHPLCSKIYLTQIHHNFNCDIFFPDYSDFSEMRSLPPQKENGLEFSFKVFERV